MDKKMDHTASNQKSAPFLLFLCAFPLPLSLLFFHSTLTAPMRRLPLLLPPIYIFFLSFQDTFFWGLDTSPSTALIP